MNRKSFLRTLGSAAGLLAADGLLTACARSVAGAPAPRVPPPAAPARLHAMWTRAKYATRDDLRRDLASWRAKGIGALYMDADPETWARLAPAGREEGVEIHAWTRTMMRGEHVTSHPEWYVVSRSGKSAATQPPYVDYYHFMCPSRDDVRAMLAAWYREVASIDGLTGVHFDYVRYPDVILPIALWPHYHLVQDREYPDFDFCYCSVCRERFRAASGIDPKDLADAPANEAWVHYRWDTITRVVRELTDVIHAGGKRATAAVFPTPTIARRLVRQDWTTWALDRVNPMLYHSFYNEPVEWIAQGVREGVAALGGRMPLSAGLYLPDLPPAELARAARMALDAGANGVTLFEVSMMTPEHWAAVAPVLRGA